MKYEEMTKKIIGCAYTVYNTMGFGFLESVYEKCLMIEMRKAGLQAKSQEPLSVSYDGEIVGEFVADIIVENSVIVELKAVKCIAVTHEIQLVNYLVATGIEVGLLINFSEQKIEVKRKIRNLKILHPVEPHSIQISSPVHPSSKSYQSCNPVKKLAAQSTLSGPPIHHPVHPINPVIPSKNW